MLVYSVTSRKSFDVVRVIREKLINETSNPAIPIVLVGNKVRACARSPHSLAYRGSHCALRRHRFCSLTHIHTRACARSRTPV